MFEAVYICTMIFNLSHLQVVEKDDFKLPTGSVFHFSDGTDKMTREDVKDVLTPLGNE